MDESLSSLQFEGRCIIIYNEEKNKHFILSVLVFFFKNVSIYTSRYSSPSLLLTSLLFAFKKEVSVSVESIEYLLANFCGFSLLGIQFNGFCCRYTK